MDISPVIQGRASIVNNNERQGNDHYGRNARPVRVGGPYWMSAPNYYVLSVAISAIFFFLIWDILRDGADEAPWATAGISAGIFLCGAVILREMILRRARTRFLRNRREMDMRGFSIRSRSREPYREGKLTLERHAAIIGEIKRKSDAAKVLSKFADGHREVFELCREYLMRNEQELKSVNAGSPRLAPLLKGRSSVAEFHRYHTLCWAEIETRSLTNDARNSSLPSEQIESAQKALSVIETALDSYPTESSLIQSHALLREMIVSIKVAGFVEEAERAAFRGDNHQAKGFYRDALFYLARDNEGSYEREQAAIKINSEIEKLDELETGK